MKKRSIFAIAISIGVFCFSLITPTLAKYETNLSLVKGEVYVPNFISQDSFVKFLNVFDQYFKNDENNKIKNNLINTEFVAHSEIEKDNIFSDLNESLKNADIRNDYLYLVQFIGHTSSSNGDSKKIESFTYKVVYSPIFAGIGSLDNVKDGSSLYSYEFNYTIDYIEGVNYYWFLIWWSKPYKEITSNFNYDTTYELLEYSLGTSKDKRIISTEKRD